MGFWADDYSSTGNVIAINRWYHVVGTYDASTNFRIFYRNGVAGDAGNTAANDFSGGTNFYISGWGHGANIQKWNGFIDDVRVYNRALTPSEIKRLYNMGR